jgi:hypothetical protein
MKKIKKISSSATLDITRDRPSNAIKAAATLLKNNELNIKGKSFVKSDYIKEILSIISSPTSDSFTKIRQLVADNSVRDFTELYKSIYDNTTEASKIIVIAEGLHNSAISSDREITFMATIAKLL